ncbi:hypothetical protein F8388_004866 [Cannabis sativa]|uniref:DUF7148 domain-containing protein n=1 Tax=Cannabis sativa TaxID=3483 RepID=A0A7J6HQ87_CANSA|nr:hypothetical protein F8388_004866 [Cannabis sativa]
MAIAAVKSLLYSARVDSHPQLSRPLPQPLVFFNWENKNSFLKLSEQSRRIYHLTKKMVAKASSTQNNDPEDGVSLGTMKLPTDTDFQRFELLLFQWANSLCQGANLPLPVPLKIDKIAGGARLGFITIEDGGKTEVLVYIDCLVFPATESSGPLFRAIRNGPKKDQAPPGEPRIMRSLLQALQKSVEIARL